MCRKRECPERIIYPFPQIDVIDLTMDELADDENGTVDNILRNDQWIHHPYNFLPSSDEEEQEIINFYELAAQAIEDLDLGFEDFTGANETNQNTNATSAASVTINLDTAETHNTDQAFESREFELDIPEILLSMSRITNHLFGRASTSQD